MFKLLGCLMVIVGCSSIGFLYGETLNKRLKQLKEFEKIILHINNEITYLFTPLPELLYKISSKSEEPFDHITKKVSKLLSLNEVEDVYEAFHIAIEENRHNLYLKDDDMNLIYDFAKNIGQCDVDGQKSILSYTKINTQKAIEEAEKVRNKNLKIYRYLGVTAGAMLVIMMI